MTTVEPIRNIDDIRKVEAVLKRQGQRNLLFFTIGTICGLRISDILALNVRDVKGKSHIQLTEIKTGKFKKFPINIKLRPMIDNYTRDKELDEPLFVTIFGNRLERVAAYYIVRDACKAAGLEEKVGTHTMRKSFGYHHYKKFKDDECYKKYLIIQVHKLL